MKTVLITGASGGIGKATALAFAQAGWNVAATLRHPENEIELTSVKGIRLYRLDVTDPVSIQTCFESVQGDFGRIDCLVNNAGFAVVGIFEAMTEEDIQAQFQTNVFGLMNCTREAIGRMKNQKGGGTIIQISSFAGRATFPLYSVYCATKWALEGFTETLQYELIGSGVRVKIVEPGVIKTNFYGRSRTFVKPENSTEYDAFIAKAEKVGNEILEKGEEPSLVARTIVKAASDRGNQLRYRVGNPATWVIPLRLFLPDSWYLALVRFNYRF
jgi:NAD(P)-dependent dehydrogenase (short-subunit alcohol dehydrogenase family)